MTFVRFAAVLAAVTVAASDSAHAGLFRSAKASAGGPTPIAEPLPLVETAAAAGCCTPCCPTPCITYRHALLPLRKVKCCDPCKPPIQAVLCVTNPCTCRPVSVPVCLPNCCCDEPLVTCRRSLLGEGVATYKWCCGVVVEVRFKKCGEVAVVYRGF